MPRRKRASASADVYRRTFESLPIGLSVWHLENADDPGSLRLLASNPAAADATGLPQDEVLGKTMAEAAANGAATAADALLRALDLICEFTKWPVRHVYVRSSAGDTLVSAHLWHLEEAERFRGLRQVSESTSFRSGIGLPGRVWQRAEPAWIIDVGADPNFPRARMLDDIGVKAAFGFPVMAQGEVAAVLEFFSPEAKLPDQELMEIMPDVGRHFGKVVERNQHTR